MSIFATSALIPAGTLAVAYGTGHFISRSITTQIEIDAPASLVWTVLTDTGA